MSEANLSFYEFQRVNQIRCEKGFKSAVSDWNALEWAGALCGEAGELANLCKKLRRGEHVDIMDLSDEIADVFTYLDLLATSLGISTGAAIASKFNRVSAKRGCPEITV